MHLVLSVFRFNSFVILVRIKQQLSNRGNISDDSENEEKAEEDAYKSLIDKM